MKKRILTLALVLALCLSLAAPAFAWEGNFSGSDPRESLSLKAGSTEAKDSQGYIYRFSSPVIGEISNFPEHDGPDEYLIEDTYYKVPVGTVVTVLQPDGTPGDFSTVEAGQGGERVDGNSYTIEWGPMRYVLYVKGVPTILRLYGVKADNASPAAPKFTDVKKGDWFYQPVQWAVDQKITAGTSPTLFSPNRNCTVSEILTFLWRAAGSPAAKALEGMDQSQFYAKAAAWAAEKGILAPEDFQPAKLCTRAMAVEFIWGAEGFPDAGDASFDDVLADETYTHAVAWAVEHGVTAGTSPTTFSPNDICNRGQIVSFLYRAFSSK